MAVSRSRPVPKSASESPAGEVGGFDVNQSFLLGITVYVMIPSLMVFCALILPPRGDRIAWTWPTVGSALTPQAAR